MIKVQKKWKIIGLLFGLSVCLCLSVQVFWPLKVREWKLALELKAAEVQSQQLGPFHLYSMNHCDPQAAGRGCSCIALLHGVGDSSLAWKSVLLGAAEGIARKGISDQLKIFAIDLLGSGQTPPVEVPSAYRARLQAEQLRAVLASQCQEWIVVGHEFGGWVASWLALDWPQGVNRLILLNSAGLKVAKQELKTWLSDPDLNKLKDFESRAYYRPAPLSQKEWNDLVEYVRRSEVRATLEAQTDDDDLDLKFRSITRPTLILWGKEDRVFPLTHAEWMRSLLPGAIYREVAECGHVPQKECPEPVIAAIADMIKFGSM